MKSNIDDQCGQLFKELKFSKKYRYLIYKVDEEKVVSAIEHRLSKKLERGNKIGLTFCNLFQPKTLECVFSTWNTPIVTI